MKRFFGLSVVFLLVGVLMGGCEKPVDPVESADPSLCSIQGKVIDSRNGQSLVGVELVLQGTDKWQTTSDADGSYSFSKLQAGTYKMDLQKEGYGAYTLEDIQLVAGQAMLLDIDLAALKAVLEITDETWLPIEELECIGTENSFRINNVGLVSGEWSIESDVDWLEFSQKSGSLAAGASKIITFKRKLQGEDQETELRIKLGEEELPLKIMSKAFVMEMVYVEGGEFEMGATADQEVEEEDQIYNEDNPVRTIKLDAYWIGKYEVTQAQWYAVMGTKPSYFKEDTLRVDLPVDRVTWEEAQDFCKKLSEATGKKYVLPTEAQWEYAARGGNKSNHTRYAGSDNLDEVAWHDENSDNETHTVGTKKANELGIYDMSGNVAEWCKDWYGVYSETETQNPQGPTSGSSRVFRGGSWNAYVVDCQVSNRNSTLPSMRFNIVGLRVVELP